MACQQCIISELSSIRHIHFMHSFSLYSAILEGKDDYANICDIYESFKERVRSACVDVTRAPEGGVIFPHQSTKVVFWGGGDMAYTSEVLGLGGHFNRKGYNCCWCEVHTNQLADKEKSEIRTLRRMYNLAHLPIPPILWRRSSVDDVGPFPFTCPGCRQVFTTMEVRMCEIVCTKLSKV